ncbi:hypothetical protein AVEN_203565-1 [Araneus ventricosus]|uniref:Uncharacterized protein n=1 Tax=Araneus ventricosus TaxID=182803 RepID=A0A4Y2FPA2_ARAVE|nr:hypothetical protein AVEN_203565-1 [Araneus ventricosus]
MQVKRNADIQLENQKDYNRKVSLKIKSCINVPEKAHKVVRRCAVPRRRQFPTRPSDQTLQRASGKRTKKGSRRCKNDPEYITRRSFERAVPTDRWKDHPS